MGLGKKEINYSLSLSDTSLIKGIAICCMLWHHLFYTHPEYGSLVFQSAQIGKVCVSLFLFLSAYGLTIQFDKLNNKSIRNTLTFQAKRFVKFYANYWIVFCIVVPLGVFVFGRTFESICQTTEIIKPFLTDFLGITSYYNATWWFNRLIISFYILFPILFYFTKRWSILALVLASILHIFQSNWGGVNTLAMINLFLLVFVGGMLYALHVKRISHFLNRFNRGGVFIALLILLGLFCYLRQHAIIPYLSGLRVDALLTFIIVLLALFALRNIPYLNGVLKYLGNHSMNIYMIHTFIYYYYFKSFIYSFQYPILIFIVLLLTSLLVSIVLEFIKKQIHLADLVRWVNNKIFL